MEDNKIIEFALKAMKLVCVSLPHLSGLANSVRIISDERIQSAGITSSGKLLINPDWFEKLELFDAVFVLAHELLHLALRTHERSNFDEGKLFNIAHDYIINLMLEKELNRSTPAEGLIDYEIGSYSAEEIVRDLKKLGNDDFSSWGNNRNFGQGSGLLADKLKKALEDNIISDKSPINELDVISSDKEQKLFPNENNEKIQKDINRIQQESAKSNSLKILIEKIEDLQKNNNIHGISRNYSKTEKALSSFYKPPWEIALQQWMEAVAPGPRSYNRASRRGSDRLDIVLPGRKREGWMLHIILDTSGSMSNTFPVIFAAISSFCEAANVQSVHIIQCDTEIRVDEYIEPNQLQSYVISGYGGGAYLEAPMELLAKDAEVEAVIIITDGYITYPDNRQPYNVLWVLTVNNYNFKPSHGIIFNLEK